MLVRDFGFSAQDILREFKEAVEHVKAELVEAAARFRHRRPQILFADDGASHDCAFNENGSWLVSAQFITQEWAAARLGTCARNPRVPRRSACPPAQASTTSTSIKTCALSRDWDAGLFVLGTCALWEFRSGSGLAYHRPVLRDAGAAIESAGFSGGGDFLISMPASACCW